MSIQSYRWYSPWELIEEAEWKLSKAEYLEENVGIQLRAQYQAHQDQTYHLRRQLEKMTEAVADKLSLQPTAPIYLNVGR